MLNCSVKLVIKYSGATVIDRHSYCLTTYVFPTEGSYHHRTITVVPLYYVTQERVEDFMDAHKKQGLQVERTPN